MKRLVLVILLGLLPLFTSAATFQEQQTIANAATPKEKGLAIVKIANERDNGWQDSEAKMLMILRNSQGQQSERNVRVRTMEVAGEGDKSLFIFDTPRDVKGTAILTWSHALRSDDQWIFRRALKRVKRISSKKNPTRLWIASLLMRTSLRRKWKNTLTVASNIRNGILIHSRSSSV